MEIQEQEYIDAYIDVKDTSSGFVYVSQETTRAIIADCWSALENHLQEANAAFNATEDEPHTRALALLNGLQEAVRHADVIYTLTPIPDEEIDET